jgi:hypothetical protein
MGISTMRLLGLLGVPGMLEELVLADGSNEFKVVWVMVFTYF